MTRFTVIRIQNDPEVFAASLGPFPNGLYGTYVGSYDETPSGSVRPRTLLSSDGVFKTAEEAKAYGDLVIQKVKAEKYEEIPTVPC